MNPFSCKTQQVLCKFKFVNLRTIFFSRNYDRSCFWDMRFPLDSCDSGKAFMVCKGDVYVDSVLFQPLKNKEKYLAVYFMVEPWLRVLLWHKVKGQFLYFSTWIKVPNLYNGGVEHKF